MDLATLIEKIDGAPRGDPELDWLITQWNSPTAVRHSSAHEHFSQSYDAALGLVDSRLRCYSITLTIDPSGNGAKLSWWPAGLGGEEVRSESVRADPCLAILSALLHVLRVRP